MSQPEFRERTFEYPLLAELDRDRRTVYQPDQVLEHVLGFDAALLTRHAVFWKRNGSKALRGTRIRSNWFGPAPAQPLWSRPLNAFLQFKCPERLGTGVAREWGYWGKPYFRFAIDPHQQKALEGCSKGLGGNGVVAYAAPAFSTLAELSAYQSNREVVRNTHFVRATALSGHGSYSYCEAAGLGRAHSDPEEVRSFSWEDMVGLGEQAAGDRNPDAVIHEAAEAVRQAMGLRPDLARVWLAVLSEVHEALSALAEVRGLADRVGLLGEFAAAEIGTAMLDVTWRVVTT